MNLEEADTCLRLTLDRFHRIFASTSCPMQDTLSERLGCCLGSSSAHYLPPRAVLLIRIAQRMVRHLLINFIENAVTNKGVCKCVQRA